MDQQDTGLQGGLAQNNGRQPKEPAGCNQAMHIKIEVALHVVDAFLDAINAMVMKTADGDSCERDLSPKEQALYIAALHKLETYIDEPG